MFISLIRTRHNQATPVNAPIASRFQAEGSYGASLTSDVGRHKVISDSTGRSNSHGIIFL